MQATRALRIASTAAARVSATPVARAGGELVAKANPNLLKVWKSYSYTRNQRIQQLSPFEIDVLGPLFRNIGHKIKHKVEVSARSAFWTDATPVAMISVAERPKWSTSLQHAAAISSVVAHA